MSSIYRSAGDIRDRRPRNVVASQAPLGSETQMPVATPEQISPLEKFKRKRKFDQDGYVRGESRTVDYNSGNQAPEPGMRDNRSYTA